MKNMFKKAVAICLCGMLVIPTAGATQAKKPKQKKLKVNSSVASKVIDIKGETRLSVKGIKTSKLKFKSLNKKVATVNKKGIVTGKKKGKVKIKVTAKKRKPGVIKITVKDLKPTALNVKQKTLKIAKGKKAKLNTKVAPGGVYCPLSFSSSNTDIAAVDKAGVVKGKADGEAQIEVKTKEKNKAGEFLTKTVKVVVGKGKPDDGKFVDGTWFGTGKRSFYYEANGPDIVKIDAEGGKVKDVAEIKKTEDPEYDYGREKLFDWVKGKDDKEVDEMLQKLIKRLQGGPQPLDTVSGATETAVGNLSAIQNAIHRSKKYSKDNKEQNINYIDFVKRPSAAQFYGDSGKTFKLDDTVMKVAFKDGTTKDVKYNDLEANGVNVSPKHGSPLPAIGSEGLIHFTVEDSLIDMPTRYQVQKEKKPAWATKIVITFKDATKHEIDLNKNDFIYNYKFDREIDKTEIFYGDRKLADGTTTIPLQWDLDISKAELPEDATHWGFKYYRLVLEPAEDNSNIKKLFVDEASLKREYKVGDELNYDNVNITATTEKGTEKHFTNWNDCSAFGITANLAKGYKFTDADAGEKELTFSYKNQDNTEVSVTVKLTIKNVDKNIPAKILMTSNEQEPYVKTIDISDEDQTKFKNDGSIVLQGITLPKKYEANWSTAFTYKVLNNAGLELNIKTEVKANILRIHILDFPLQDEQFGRIMFRPKFVD